MWKFIQIIVCSCYKSVTTASPCDDVVPVSCPRRRQYTKSCDVTCANLKEHLKKKSAMTSLSHTDYRNKLDDYYSVKSQIYDYTNRDRDIHKQLARMSEVRSCCWRRRLLWFCLINY